MKNLLCRVGLLIWLVSCQSAYAASPVETVKEDVTTMLTVFRDPSLQGDSKKALRWQRLRAAAEPMFADREIARRALARNWHRFSTAQQDEFVDLFRKLLEKVYTDRILSYSYTNEQVVTEKQTMVADNRAEVETKIITSSQQIPVTFRLILTDGAWKVYDAVIEGVSLIENYRSQFNELLAKNSPDQVLDMLRKKVEGTSPVVEKPS
ncbi:MAG TPA: ABC transporter substrate-binding protein [Syntrophobacteria bacterium]|nr:ABC transporter substrate-binding protein [Syntrophobacteria bacterium]